MRKNADIVFSSMLVVVFGYIFFEGMTLDERSRAFPVAIAAPMLALALFSLGRMIWTGYVKEPVPEVPAIEPGELTGSQRMESLATAGRVEIDAATTRKRIINILLWMAASFVLLWMIGFREGLPIFVFLFIWKESKDKLWFATVFGICTWLVLHFFFGYFLNYPWHTPQIALWLGFEWPGVR